MKELIEAVNVMFRDNAPMSAAEAATVILQGVRDERWRILVGDDAVALDKAVRAAPEEAYEGMLLASLDDDHRRHRVDSPTTSTSESVRPYSRRRRDRALSDEARVRARSSRGAEHQVAGGPVGERERRAHAGVRHGLREHQRPEARRLVGTLGRTHRCQRWAGISASSIEGSFTISIEPCTTPRCS